MWLTFVVFSESSEDVGDSPVAMETETPQVIAQAGAAYSKLTVVTDINTSTHCCTCDTILKISVKKSVYSPFCH